RATRQTGRGRRAVRRRVDGDGEVSDGAAVAHPYETGPGRRTDRRPPGHRNGPRDSGGQSPGGRRAARRRHHPPREHSARRAARSAGTTHRHPTRNRHIRPTGPAATSAEQAQVRAAQAQARIEAARIEAERGAAAGDANATRTCLDLARRESERARRLYEQKAYSQRQLEAAEAELRTAQAASEA